VLQTSRRWGEDAALTFGWGDHVDVHDAHASRGIALFMPLSAGTSDHAAVRYRGAEFRSAWPDNCPSGQRLTHDAYRRWIDPVGLLNT
jgi:hypothetical protein